MLCQLKRQDLLCWTPPPPTTNTQGNLCASIWLIWSAVKLWPC